MQERLHLKRKYDSSTDYLSTLHSYQYTIGVLLTIVPKTLQEKEPQYLADKLHISTLDTMTRLGKLSIKLLHVPFNQKKDTRGQRIRLSGSNNCNKLPNYIKEAENLGKFQKKTKKKPTYLDYPITNNQ